MLTIIDYKTIPTWEQTFTGKVKLDYSRINSTWRVFFADIIKNANIIKLEKELTDKLKKNNKIYPYPSLIFNAFMYTRYDILKCVIIGQDPYFNFRNKSPEAMGLSFSVPTGQSIPSSLNNIFKNLVKYNHITTMPNHGNLDFWALQGVLMLNTSLTVTDGEPNSHQEIWASFTNAIITKLSQEKDHLIFVLWGKPALAKEAMIDKTKHKIIVSSHPSGLSCSNNLGSYPAFNNNDHFGQVNKYLIDFKEKPIIWQL